MAAVWMRFRAELRSRARAWLGLALLVGVAAGVVIAAAAGARRTDTAYARFLDHSAPIDAMIGIPFDCPPREERATGPGRPPLRCADAEDIAALPGVDAAAELLYYGPGEVAIRTVDGEGLQPEPGDAGYSGPGEIILVAGVDRSFGSDVQRYQVLEGRRPDPESADEVALNVEVARRLDLHPGDRLVASFPKAPPHEFEIVGTEVAPFEVAPPSGQWEAFVHATPAFAAEQIARGNIKEYGVAVRLDAGEAGLDPLGDEIFQRGYLSATMPFPASVHDDVERGIRPYTIALWIGAALAALAAIGVVGQALTRHVFLESADNSVLWTLGSSRRQLFALGLLRAATIGIAGAIVAVGLAIALSPLTPVGSIARTVEVDPGVSIAPFALAAGALATVLFAVGLAALPNWRVARAHGTERVIRRRPSATVAAFRRGSLPPTAVVGVGIAFEPGRGRAAVPVRSTLVGVTVALLAVTAAVTFSVSLGHLISTPRLAGWNWDVAGALPRKADDRDAMITALARHPEVDGVSAGTFHRPFPSEHALELGSERVPVELVAFDAGTVGPTVLHGRAPAAADEILLGPHTLADLDLEIGDTVTAAGQVGKWGRPETWEEVTRRFEIVGTGIVPIAGGEARLGRGATLTLDGLRRYDRAFEVEVAYLDLQPGADPNEVVRDANDSIGAPIGPRDLGVIGYDFVQNADLLNLEQVDRLPLVLAFLLVVLGVGSLVHVMVSAVRTRRRDLAVLRTLGFVGRQVGSTIAWQATAVTSVAALVGIPLGIVAGRAIWRVFAERLGVVPEPVLPWWGIAVIVAGAVLVANLAAVGPAWFAARTRPASVLRSE
jgi:hypothetical protein